VQTSRDVFEKKSPSNAKEGARAESGSLKRGKEILRITLGTKQNLVSAKTWERGKFPGTFQKAHGAEESIRQPMRGVGAATTSLQPARAKCA